MDGYRYIERQIQIHRMIESDTLTNLHRYIDDRQKQILRQQIDTDIGRQKQIHRMIDTEPYTQRYRDIDTWIQRHRHMDTDAQTNTYRELQRQQYKNKDYRLIMAQTDRDF